MGRVPRTIFTGRSSTRALLEMAGASAPDEATWAQRVCEATRPLLPQAIGVGLQVYEHTPAFAITGVRTYGVGTVTSERVESTFDVLTRVDVSLLRAAYYPRAPAMMMSGVFEHHAHARWALDHFALVEIGGIVAHPAQGRVAVLCFELEQRHVLLPYELQLCSSISMFLAAGLSGLAHGAHEAVFSPDARLLEGALPPHGLWAGLSSGRYRLSLRGIAAQKHLVLVENNPVERARRRLSERELQVLELCARGRTGKEQSWELKLTQSSISRLLTSAGLKLGLASTSDALRFVSGCLNSSRRREFELTDSEREVLALVQQGLSNAQIARHRQRSPRTIANQVASLLRKTGAPGRRAMYPVQSHASLRHEAERDEHLDGDPHQALASDEA